MTVPKKKVSFERIFKLMRSIDTICGAFLLRDSTKKKTIKDQFFKYTMLRNLLLYTFFMISSLIITDFELISIIIGGSLATVIFAIFAGMFYFKSNKGDIKNQLKWCESLYDVQKKFHKVILDTAEAQLITTERQCSKFLKWIRIIFYVDIVGITLGFDILGIFLPENVLPKFSLPVPFYLPFKNQKTWFAFITTIILQILVSLDAATLVTFLFGFSFGVFIHILGYLDIILQTVKKMKHEMLVNTNQFEINCKLLKNPTLNIRTLTAINNSMSESQNNTLTFDEWIKILNEMISDVSSIITSLSNLLAFPMLIIITSAGTVYAIPLLFLELAGLGSLFICGLLFTVIREQYFFAAGINIVCFCLFIACFVNEKFFDKFEEINNALYDIPWYDLTPNQRKSLMLLLHCDKIQKGLTAAKIHSLTIERFGIIVKAGYTNLLALKDLVQK